MTSAKILIVEDDFFTRRLIERQVRKCGHEVVGQAEATDEAVEKARALQPDLVLMDIELKDGGDGVATASKIQEVCKVPVIYITSHTDDPTLQRAKITEPYGYLVKPPPERELAITIELSLYRRKAEREREKLLAELQEALRTIKTLSGFLPICSSCKKIRDEKGTWTQMEVYVQSRSNAEFTHGICPECAKKVLDSLHAPSR